jgi:DnaK suppressor protein
VTYGPAETVHASLAAARADAADLHREMAAIAESTALVPDDEHDAEGSTIGYERARVATLVARAERRIADLVVADERVRAGTYECCERCGGDIGAERLEALPATRVCVRCADRDAGRDVDRDDEFRSRWTS